MADSPGNRTGAQILAEMLSAYGVTHFFLVPSVFNLGLMEMERRTSIVRVQAHGEKAAAYMADGYARVSGRPGVCAAQVVGALNLAAGLRDAHLAHSPVIALTGGRHPRLKFKRVYQEVDDVPAFEQVTKFNATVDEVTRFPDMIRQAFRSATTGCPGPVHLQFQGNEGQIDAESGPMEPVVETRFASVPPFRPRPDDADVAQALALLRAARRPVLVVGGGARMSGAGAEVIRVAEVLQIPLATSLNGKQLVRPATRCRSAWSVPIPARAPTRWWRRPTWCASWAARPGAWSRPSGPSRRPGRRSCKSTSMRPAWGATTRSPRR